MSRLQLNLDLDLIGFGTSLLCALHCAILPFLLQLVPLAGLQFLSDPRIEYIIILISFCIASYALVHGYRRHHQKPFALIIVIIGFILIGSGYLLHSPWQEIMLTSSGAVIVAIAHLINWNQVKQSHIEYPDCLHLKKSSK